MSNGNGQAIPATSRYYPALSVHNSSWHKLVLTVDTSNKLVSYASQRSQYDTWISPQKPCYGQATSLPLYKGSTEAHQHFYGGTDRQPLIRPSATDLFQSKLATETKLQIIGYLDDHDKQSLQDTSYEFCCLVGALPCNNSLEWATRRCRPHGHQPEGVGDAICERCVRAAVRRIKYAFCLEGVAPRKLTEILGLATVIDERGDTNTTDAVEGSRERLLQSRMDNCGKGIGHLACW